MGAPAAALIALRLPSEVPETGSMIRTTAELEGPVSQAVEVL
jgi:hypothetical protein